MSARAETSFHPGTHTSWRAPQHDGKQGLKAGGVCIWVLFVCVKKDVCSRRPAKRNLSKRLVIHWNGLSVSLSIQDVLPVSAAHSITASRKPYRCCNPTSNQTAVILCHSPTILYWLSTSDWEDIDWDCVKVEKICIFFFYFFFFFNLTHEQTKSNLLSNHF